MSDSDDKAIVKNMVDETAAPPVDTEKPAKVSTGKRETIAPPKTTPQESFLAQEALVFEQSWFVEADCSATRDQLGFIVRPHQDRVRSEVVANPRTSPPSSATTVYGLSD